MFHTLLGEAVNVVEHGRGDPTILAVTGAFGTAELWQPPFQYLHRRHRTVSFDHFGTGLTEVPPERVTFDEQVALVGAVADHLGDDRIVLAGDSSMTAVVIGAAARWPDRFAGLVLVAGKHDHSPDEPTRRFAAWLRSDFSAALDFFAAACLPEDQEGHWRRWFKAIITRTGAERAAALVELFYEVDVPAMLPDVAVPTLVVHGTLDTVTPPDHAVALAAAIPDAELVLIEGAGHAPTLSRPGEVAEHIERFTTALP